MCVFAHPNVCMWFGAVCTGGEVRLTKRGGLGDLRRGIKISSCNQTAVLRGFTEGQIDEKFGGCHDGGQGGGWRGKKATVNGMA